jgi:hypothetical protein
MTVCLGSWAQEAKLSPISTRGGKGSSFLAVIWLFFFIESGSTLDSGVLSGVDITSFLLICTLKRKLNFVYAYFPP